MESQMEVQITTIMGKPESQVDMVKKSTKLMKKRWSFIEITLSVLLLLTIITLGALVVLYTTQRGKQFSSSKVCMTEACVTAAARLIQNMDPSASPCDDFYKYACDGWMKRHVIPETASSYTVFDMLNYELDISLKGILERPDDRDRDAFKKAKQLYNVCMNYSLIAEQSSEPLLNLLDAIGGLPVATPDWEVVNEPGWSLGTILSQFAANYNKNVFVTVRVWSFIKNSSRHIIYIDEPTLGMPTAGYYLEDGNSKKVREAYFQFMIAVAKIIREERNITKNDTFVEEEMMKVLELEVEIANATSISKKGSDLAQTKMTIAELQMSCDIHGFNWIQFIQGIMSSVDIEVQPEEEIVVFGIEYLQRLKYILPKYSKSTIQNYLVWELIRNFVSYLNKRFRDAEATFKKVFYGTSMEEADWRKCISYVSVNMKSAVGALYVREKIASESKRMVKDLIEIIREAFIETLDELEWMDPASKQKAQEKAMRMKEQIGYPDYILEEDNPELDQEYAHLNFSEGKFFEHILENLKAEAHKELRKLRKPMNHDEWLFSAAVVNAVYIPSWNQMVFPAGILQPPFFSEHQLQALNFGGIGMIIGHEITHGFDGRGKNYDKDGNAYDWWSNFSITHFKDKSNCMVDQYSNYTWDLAGGQKISGINTLDENIADNGGVRQAYKAYMKWVKKEGEENKLPGLNLTHKQLFFLSHAQKWCGLHRPEYAIQTIKFDEHTPVKFRVLGSLQNFEAFAEAFQCSSGNVMHPVKKCRVW